MFEEKGNRSRRRERRWKSGKPGFGFPLFQRTRSRSCVNVGIARCVRDFQGAVGRVGKRVLLFHAFHGPGIYTAVFALAAAFLFFLCGPLEAVAVFSGVDDVRLIGNAIDQRLA